MYCSQLRLEFDMEVAKWVIITIAGALLGAFVKTGWDSANPSIHIVQIEPSTGVSQYFETDGVEIPTPKPLQDLVQRSNWTSVGLLRKQFIPYTKLIEALDDNRVKMTQLKKSISAFEDDYPVLMSSLRGGGEISDIELNEFFDIWERNDGFIYAAILGDYRRNTFELRPTNYDGESRLFVYKDKDGDWLVNKKGGRFPSYMAINSSRNIPLQKEVAEALGYFDKARLKTYLEHVSQDAPQYDIADQLLQVIADIERQISRFSLSISLSNSGKNAIAFLPYAVLTIETDGLTQNGVVIDGDTEIILQHRNHDKKLSPIQIRGNSARLVDFYSRDLIMNLKNTEAVLSAFELGSVKYSVKFFASGGGLFTKQIYTTERAQFKPFEYSISADLN